MILYLPLKNHTPKKFQNMLRAKDLKLRSHLPITVTAFSASFNLSCLLLFTARLPLPLTNLTMKPSPATPTGSASRIIHPKTMIYAMSPTFIILVSKLCLCNEYMPFRNERKHLFFALKNPWRNDLGHLDKCMILTKLWRNIPPEGFYLCYKINKMV